VSFRDDERDRVSAGGRTSRRPPVARRPSAANAATMLGNRAFSQLVQRQSVTDDLGWMIDTLTPISLSGSVGRDADNNEDDVLHVRERLYLLGFPPGETLDELAQAISEYQRLALHFKHPDGKIDPGGQTIAGLNAYKLADQPAPQPPPNPNPTPNPTPTPDGGLQPGDVVWAWGDKTSQTPDIPQKAWFDTTAKSDYGGHGKDIYQYVVYPDHVKRGQPHMRTGKGSFAWLNNNPGNLTAGGANVGEYQGKRNWHHFLIFPSVDAGMEAIPKFLKANGYGPLSISDAFERYAPKKDGNDPEHYAKMVADATGVGLDTKINDLSEEQLKEVAKAIQKMEGSVAGDTLSRNDPTLPEAIRNRL
jgi:hypothetical protein